MRFSGCDDAEYTAAQVLEERAYNAAGPGVPYRPLLEYR